MKKSPSTPSARAGRKTSTNSADKLARAEALAAFAAFNPNPVLEFSSEGKLTYFNEAAAEMARSLGKDNPSEVLPLETHAIIRTCLVTGQKKLRLETTQGGRTWEVSIARSSATGWLCRQTTTTSPCSTRAM